MRTERRTWCGLCHERCGLLIGFDRGRAVSVKGDPDHPLSRGRTCSRGRMILEHLYHAERVNHPLRRSGERGEGRWERITWKEAMDDIAEKLHDLRDRFGPETLAFCRGTSRTYHWDARRFFNLFGSPNMTGANQICFCPSLLIETALCGTRTAPDTERTKCLVIWGTCRSVSSGTMEWPGFVSAKRRGAKVITVDPRRTKEADLADIWLRIRPGADVALMLGWLNVILKDGLYDREFVDRWTAGFDEVRALALKYPPEAVSKITWIPEGDIVESARLYASSKPAAITWSYGIDKQGINSLEGIHARVILRAITGNIDIPGGEVFGGTERVGRIVPALELEMNSALTELQRRKILGGARYPLFSFAFWEELERAVSALPPHYIRPPNTGASVSAHPHDVFRAALTGDPYPVRAMICQASNPLLTLADSKRTFHALRALDLLVVMDYYTTPTAALADYILPAASTIERDDIEVMGSLAIANPRALEPLHERRSDYEFWMDLGRRLDQREFWQWGDAKEVCDFRLAPAGLTFEDLRSMNGLSDKRSTGRSRLYGFGTPSGKVELHSSLLEKYGLPPLPDYHPVREPDTDFPLLLITGSRFMPMYHSEQRQWKGARRMAPDPMISLHPQTAISAGIDDGDWVKVETWSGAICMKARLSDAIHPKTADCQHGWWYPERGCTADNPFGLLDANVNLLTSDSGEFCSEGTGAWPLTGIPCRVRRMEAK